MSDGQESIADAMLAPYSSMRDTETYAVITGSSPLGVQGDV